MQVGRDIRPFIVDIVTEGQSHPTSTPIGVGKIFEYVPNKLTAISETGTNQSYIFFGKL